MFNLSGILSPGTLNRKKRELLIALGIGNVKVGRRDEDASYEELELVEYIQLGPEELAEIREVALALEAHAFDIGKEVYFQTLPSKFISP